jgi:hypothetical protein
LCLTYETGSGLDDWIYRHLLHITRDYRQYCNIASLITLQFTVKNALGFSVFTSRILAMDLYQSHCNFKSHMKSYFHSLIHLLSLFCNCQFRRLHLIRFLLSQAHILAGKCLATQLYSMLFDCRTFFTTTLNGPRRKKNL